MPNFSKRSIDNLAEAHPLIQKVFNEAIKTTPVDFVVIEGYRGEAEQNEAFRKGNSRAKFGQSAHNYKPSLAVDIVPYPQYFDAPIAVWERLDRHILETAKRLEVPLRKIGTWDRPHFELDPWRSFIVK